MDRETFEKIAHEQALTIEEALELDFELEESASMQSLLHGMEDPTPSLAWRSELNSRLLAVSPRAKKTKTWAWLSGFSLTGLAVAGLVMVFAKPPTSSPVPDQPTIQLSARKSPAVEESLINAHHEADIESGMGVAYSQSGFESQTSGS